MFSLDRIMKNFNKTLTDLDRFMEQEAAKIEKIEKKLVAAQQKQQKSQVASDRAARIKQKLENLLQ